MAVLLAGAAYWGCAKGTEISPNEIVYLSPLPPDGPDASVDAGALPSGSVDAVPAEPPPAEAPADAGAPPIGPALDAALP